MHEPSHNQVISMVRVILPEAVGIVGCRVEGRAGLNPAVDFFFLHHLLSVFFPLPFFLPSFPLSFMLAPQL